MTKLFTCILRNRKGVSALEFALLAPVLFSILLGTMDLGYESYFRYVLRGVMDDVARQAAVGKLTADQVDTLIRNQVRNLIPASSRNNGEAFKVNRRAFFNFTNVNQPERITSDTIPIGRFNTGDCYEDANGNNQYDRVGGTSGIGGADDIVFYEVVATFPRLFPTPAFFGWDENMEVTTSTIIRNLPFSDQTRPKIRCTT